MVITQVLLNNVVLLEEVLQLPAKLQGIVMIQAVAFILEFKGRGMVALQHPVVHIVIQKHKHANQTTLGLVHTLQRVVQELRLLGLVTPLLLCLVETHVLRKLKHVLVAVGMVLELVVVLLTLVVPLTVVSLQM